MSADDLEVRIAARRAKQRRSAQTRMLIMAGVAVLIVGVLLILLLRTGRGQDKKAIPSPLKLFDLASAPSPDKEGQEWSLVEMTDYLKSKGVKVELRREDYSAYLVQPGSEADMNWEYAIAYKNKTRSDSQFLKRGSCVIMKAITSQVARDWAGSTTDPGFAWGRYAFSGSDPQLIDEIRNAIGR